MSFALRILLVCSAAACLEHCSVAAATTLQTDGESHIEIDNGIVVGLRTATYQAFRGIPYAEPPVGDLRWRPPRAKQSWRPSRWNAKEFRHNCLQDPSANYLGYVQPLETLSEDCLYLNVFAPARKTSIALPVMFWIHGGGFGAGGANVSVLNGTWDMTASGEELIIVTTNYRLGIFGFLAAEELRSRDPLGGTGNYGILDQRMAMQWVQANIHAFGGDPKRVFIVGQSAGACSVSHHLVRPASWGLFSRAGLESGAFYDNPYAPTVESRRYLFEDTKRHLGCKEGDSVACLLALPAQRVLQVTLLQGAEAFGPVVDGVDLQTDGWRLANEGKLAPVPILVGSVSEDGSVSNLNCKFTDCTKHDFKVWAKRAFLNTGIRELTEQEIELLVALYGDDEPVEAGTYSRWYWAAEHALADQWSGCMARRTAIWATKAGQRAYYYRWTYAPKGVNGHFPQLAHHGVEEPFIFHILSETPAEVVEDGGGHTLAPADVMRSLEIVRYWTSMAAHGRPSGEMPWPTFDLHTRAGLVIGEQIRAERDLRGSKCDFWDSLMPHSAQDTVVFS
eukprot:TRINITY_DN19915_c0_g2_i1.p1 TRINITY_DN19915_c0_g2~~TRINITY_DN19915_c0_g2_i1.p1  ORF type:complete len:563 (+),score=55.45 TRINITY_DN19915_c0_g2_i1:142-1830(+)